MYYNNYKIAQICTNVIRSSPFPSTQNALFLISSFGSPRDPVSDILPVFGTPTARAVGPPTVGVVRTARAVFVHDDVDDVSRSKCLYPLLLCSFISGVLGVIFRPIGEDNDFNDQAFFVAKCVGVGGVLALVIIFIDKCCDDLPGSGAGSFDDDDSDTADRSDSTLSVPDIENPLFLTNGYSNSSV
jgi:hypothetical protein